MKSHWINAAFRNSRRKARAAEASARAEAKALAACENGWAPFPGSGVHLATLRRLERKKLIEYVSETDPTTGLIVCRFRKTEGAT